MGVKLTSSEIDTIPVQKMKDGQIGEIADTGYRGRIVQRYGDLLISVGLCSGSAWTQILTSNSSMHIRLLNAGESFFVTEETTH
jgi:hypothetical protein